MLHIFNGDATAEVFAETGLPGTALAWHEALIAGPVPNDTFSDNWINVRANHLAAAYEKEVEQCRETLLEMKRVLQKADEHDEIVLWFEHDLFCQVNLLALLDAISRFDIDAGRLAIISIDTFPGVDKFHGMGQLTPAQLASLFEKRQEVSPEMISLAQEAWQAYTSPNPESIQALLRQDTTALPFLKSAFSAHLSRFPSTVNGLGFIENAALDLIVGGVDEFKPLFPMFSELHPQFGLGDWQFWNHLVFLSRLGTPLLEIYDMNRPGQALCSGDYRKAYFKLTRAGKAILVGNSDNLNINKVDYWLGGVHLIDHNPVWRWDSKKKQLVRET